MSVINGFEVIRSPKASLYGAREERVAVFGHPADIDSMRYVAGDILIRLSCDAYIPSADTPPTMDDLRILLDDASLAAFVVSRRFLFEDNLARQTILDMAKEAHTRLLFVQMDEGIEQDFDHICGPYQLLRAADKDYPDALTSFIDGKVSPYKLIMSPDDARLYNSLLRKRGFISYRKKDRALLSRLVERVRACPQLVDVALWFDDALVPGEDYNEQIERELDRADFVLFMVTPAFMEKGNYVLEREYPQAVAAGKPFVAVATHNVDGAALAEAYPQLGACVSWDEPGAVEAALRAATGTDEAHSPSPRQKYLLAREYSIGERTERNSRLSHRLYLESAEEGDAWAMARLAADYNEGVVLPKDPAEARKWCERAVPGFVELMRATAAEGQNTGLIAQTLSNLASQLARDCVEKRDYDGARAAVDIQLEAVNNMRESGIQSGRNNGGVALLHMGQVCMAQGAYDEALAYFDRAEGYLQTFEMLGSVHALLNATELYVNRGHILTERLRQAVQEEGDWEPLVQPACADLENALVRCRQTNDATHANYEFTFQAARELLLVAPFIEGQDPGVRESSRLYQLCLSAFDYLWRIDDLPGVDTQELAYQLGMAAYQTATAGRIIPDYDLLDRASRLFNTLAKYNGADKYETELKCVEFAQSIAFVRSCLDHSTRWMPLSNDPEQLATFFLPPDGIVEEGVFGPVQGNFRRSAYRCPHCHKTLYKTVFPAGREFLLPVGEDGKTLMQCARVFACPHGHFYVSPRGRRLVDGPVLTAWLLENPDCLQDVAAAWWWYFDQLGDLYAQRQD